MRNYEAANAPRAKLPPTAGTDHGDRWSDLDYLLATGMAAAVIAPAAFFWAPPLWILTLMSPISTANRNSSGRAHLKREPITSRPRPPARARAANDNQEIEMRLADLAS